MPCEAFEDRILSCRGNLLNADEREEVQRHLASCADCRRLVQQLDELDAALTRSLATAALPPGFADRVRRRIQAEAASAEGSALPVEERKRQLQLEYEAGAARLRDAGLSLRPLLRWVVYSALVAVAGWLLGQFVLNGGAGGVETFRWASPSAGGLLPLASGLLLLLGLAAALAPRRRRGWALA